MYGAGYLFPCSEMFGTYSLTSGFIWFIWFVVVVVVVDVGDRKPNQ